MTHPSAFAKPKLRVLATTDLHMHMMAYDYYTDRPNDAVGLVRTATLIRQAREEASALGIPVLLFDNGDALQGTPLADFLADQNGLHPLIEVMHELGYDAAALGNHDFNYGLEFLNGVTTQARFPFLSSNIHMAKESAWCAQTILRCDVPIGQGQKQALNIGVFGVAPPQTLCWNRTHLEGKVSVEDITVCGIRTAKELRDNGADLVIALAHTGIGEKQSYFEMENAALPLASVAGIDVLITGHTHLLLPGDHYKRTENVDAISGQMHGKPAVMPGADGAFLGVIDLTLEQLDGHWRIAEHRCALRPIARRNSAGTVRPLVKDDPRVAALIAPAHNATLKHIRQSVGQTAIPLHSYFAMLQPCAALALVAQAQGMAVRKSLAGGADATLPLLSAVAPYKSGGRSGPEHYTNVPSGDIQLRNIADLHLFPDTVAAVKVSGNTIADWLEMSASVFHQIERGTTSAQPLLDPEFPGYGFDVIYGLKYRIDLTVPPRFKCDGQLHNPLARRVSDLSWNEKPVQPEQVFMVAVNNYRATGGGNFPGLGDASIVHHTPHNIRDAIEKYLYNTKAGLWSNNVPWCFKSLGNTPVIYETGPGAQAYMSDISSMSPKEFGLNKLGFLRIRLTL